VNTVLASIAAKAFKEFADAIEKGATPKSVAQKALKDSWKVSQVMSYSDYSAERLHVLLPLCHYLHIMTLEPSISALR
jgi:hypothetical protein